MYHDSMTIDRARELRRNQTEVEKRLWAKLRAWQLDGAKFRRQAPIGPYIADFVCFERLLVIELEAGSTHRPSLPTSGGPHGSRVRASA
jgi:very-short-patch-repair endonuclease